MKLTSWRAPPAAIAIAAAVLVPFAAQAQQSTVCERLESQLAAFDRGSSDPARAEQILRYEEAANRQQAELDRQTANARRLRCEGNSFFVLFSSQAPQCGPINAQIQQMRGNLERIRSDIERLRGAGGPERDGQRRAILVALAQSNCGAQYGAQVAAAPPARSGGLFEQLFGPGSIFSPGESSTGAYRTICVRTCDGYYYPISYSTSPASFANDEQACQRSCPAAEVMLFSHRNPGEDVEQAVSISGQLYTSLPNAFRYRQSFDASCSCRRPGETWAQALKNLDDTTVEHGDIVVNEERARSMSQPRVDAQGKPIRPDPRMTTRQTPAQVRTATPAAATAASGSPPSEKPDPNRTVRAVGPTFLPAR